MYEYTVIIVDFQISVLLLSNRVLEVEGFIGSRVVWVWSIFVSLA